ncbi:hypothetical protein [Natronoflexus pectinivorans]|uniref:Uncharacterized protein n=1 Tax=Natronoflexus pectinivorans TaxID=682526 RepID=A0A4R2G6N6_9BACT|nr:hypothetical protein [Natronoflexus pectinivorans]TCO03290.1 hypothetical protein EV194_1212 [Natronoflexus pectinivorans]
MQLNQTKRKYISPHLMVVEIDNTISIIMGSADENVPPPPPFGASSSGFDEDRQDESIQKSSFDDNPFRR